MNKSKYLKGPCAECGGHLEFPVELVGTTTDCPHCGQQTVLMIATPKQESGIPRKAIVWTVIAIVVLLLGLGGALMALSRAQRQLAARQQRESATTAAAPQAASNTNAGREPTADDSAAQAGFQVTGLKLEKTPGSSLVHAVGTLTNRSARKRFGVRIELDLLDAAGQKVGSAKDYQAVIEPNAQWDFKAPVMASKASSAKLASIQEDQ